MQPRSKLMTLLPLFLVLVIDTMGVGLIFPVLGPLFMDPTTHIVAAGTSVAMRQFYYGMTLASFSIAMFMGAPFLGDLSDKLGRKKVIILSLVMTGLGYVISAYGLKINSIGLLIFGRVVAGFFAGSQPIAQAAIADISSAKNKAVNMSLMIFANCIGFIIGPMFGGYFADTDTVSWFTFSTPFYAAGLLALLNAAMLMYTFRETYKIDSSKKLRLVQGLFVFASAFRDKRIRLLSFALFTMETAWALYFLYLTLYMVQVYHYDGVQIGHYMSYYGAIWAVTLTLLVRVMVHYFRLEVSLIGWLIIYGFSILLLYIHNPWVLWLSAIPIGIGSGWGYSGMVTLFSNSVDKDSQGWAMGITSCVVAGAWGIGGLLAGFLGHWGVNFPFAVACVLTLLSPIFLYIHMRR